MNNKNNPQDDPFGDNVEEGAGLHDEPIRGIKPPVQVRPAAAFTALAEGVKASATDEEQEIYRILEDKLRIVARALNAGASAPVLFADNATDKADFGFIAEACNRLEPEAVEHIQVGGKAGKAAIVAAVSSIVPELAAEIVSVQGNDPAKSLSLNGKP